MVHRLAHPYFALNFDDREEGDPTIFRNRVQSSLNFLPSIFLSIVSLGLQVILYWQCAQK